MLSCLACSSIAQTTTYSYTGTVATYTVPPTITSISIQAIGAQGGSESGSGYAGGHGAIMKGNFTVVPGHVLNIMVGQQPTAGSYLGGGGGGSFVWDVTASNALLIAAGGGGGAGYNYTTGPGVDASTTTTGANGASPITAGGGSGGNGASAPTGANGAYGAGGAGWLSNGASGYAGGACTPVAVGGSTPLSGGYGGSYGGSAGSDGNGGYGGGGGSQGYCSWAGPGGGGGYSGGSGGAYTSTGYSAGGGGGGSYNGGASQTNTAGSATGNGSVTITVLCASPGTITGAFSLCPATTTTISNPTGATGTWYSSNTAVATINPTTGLVTAISAGTTIITDSITNVCGGVSPTQIVTVNPIPAAISGTFSMCTGTTQTLSDALSGGTWTSSSAAATIGSTTGIVTANSAGTTNIIYSVLGCTATSQLTVNLQPAAISPSSAAICPGNTASLTDATTPGTWSSSNNAIGSVSTTGVVTGASGGTATISYTLAGGCFSTASVVVNPVAAIAGATSICNGTTSTLSDAVTPGTWFSSNTAVATVGTSSGILTGLTNGTTNLTYTVTSTGCKATAVASIGGLPNVYSMTGGGAYCSGGSGVHIGLTSSDASVGYQLYNGTTPVGVPKIGVTTGATLDFGLITAAGTYTVVANPGSTCTTNMYGSETVTVNALPTLYAITGGGNYCSGGAGVHIGLDGSSPGTTYQLFNGTTPVGTSVLGTGFAIDFGLVAGISSTYNVVATNSTTGCTNTMTGTTAVGTNSLPTVFAVTGGGGYCLGGTGVNVGLSSSATGVNYQLYNGGVPVGSPVAGTGSAISFGLTTSAAGATSYTVIATNPTTTCAAAMSGSAVVTLNPLPTVYGVTGGGAYCAGSTGVPVGLNGSATGVNYQLYTGSSPVGTPLAGTGVALSFGLVTTLGSYTIQATNTTTTCVSNMSGSAAVSLSPLPSVFTVTGGGGYCASGTGVNIGLSGSTSGATYQLYNGLTLIGAASGTGSAINFGLETAVGSYTVVGINTSTTGCSGNMSGSVLVTINPLPAANNVTGGGNYCAGGTGVSIGLNGSVTGVNYQLYNGTAMVGAPFAGTGSPFNFTALATVPGAYTIVATYVATGCTNNMAGSTSVGINPLPTPFALTGGGGYCAGGSGLHVGLASSNTGISYVLSNSGTAFATVPGAGAPIDFGAETIAGTYTVTATNTTTNCTSNMSGSAVITITTLPTPYSVNGGGAYCTGGTGVPVGLSGSVSGVNYQLYNGLTTVGLPVAGLTGSPISFGLQTGAGAYTVIATNTTTTCANNMIGSASVSITPLPSVYTVTGGGVNCVGGAGVLVGLSNSATGVNYQLMSGTSTVGAPVPGTNAAISFGLIATAGAYTVVATSAAAPCSSNMSGSATVTTLTSALPGLYSVSGGGNYCAGGTGVHILLSGSAVGFNYQLFNGTALVGAPRTGTSAALDFGLQTAPGTYTVVATNTATGCNRLMTGSATVVVNTLPGPHNVTGGGSYCASGTGVSIGLNGSDPGVNYQLYEGATAIGSPIPGTGIALTFGTYTATGIYTIVGSNTTNSCVNNMPGSATIGTYPLPVVYNATGGGNYCSGGAGVNITLNNSNSGITYQLYNTDSIPVGAPIAGSGTPINFGLQTLAGPYTVVATNTVTGCTNDMTGTPMVVITSLPNAYMVTGGGPYCMGGTGAAIGLSGSDPSTEYQLFNGLVLTGSHVAGTGAAISFAPQTVAGTYTILATNTATGCTNVMADSAQVSVSTLPTAYTLSGGGNYCSGGAGIDISLDSSDPGITYQLYYGTTPMGSAMTGTGAMIDFGNQTAAGTYIIVATDSGSLCSSNMTGSATIMINPLPTAYVLSGGGNYCAGGVGLNVLLNGSNTGNTYQLYLDSVAVGIPIPGTGLPLNFGPQKHAGSYMVIATHHTTGCMNTMSGTITISVNPLPAKYAVAGFGSNYCAGGAGIDIALSKSDLGINYQLYNGSTLIGAVKPGTGTPLDFGFNTIAGNYSINAINPVTGCVDTMTGITSITIDPLPLVHSITGGGSYCSGGTGVNIGLSASNLSVAYQLTSGSGPVGSIVYGTGSSISFGAQTVGGPYTVVATDTANGCSSNMSGTATVAVNLLPTPYTTTGGGNYCASGTGVPIGLSNSSVGVSYHLLKGTLTIGGAMAGTGSSIEFGPQTGAGNYMIIATNTTTSCTDTMPGSVAVVIDPIPTPHPVTGGGSYCPGGTGVLVGMSTADAGVSYQLYYGSSPVGGAILGTGTGFNFGNETAAGTYTVVATNSATGCPNTMSGSAMVNISATPDVYTVTGGGNYCAGGAGVGVGLSGSNTGINYTLYETTSGITTVAGSGSPLDLGLHTAGIYTVLATDAVTGCTANMTGTVSISATTPVIPSVTISTGHGDTLCSGVMNTFTANPTNGGSAATYQWMVNGTVVGAAGSSYTYTPSNGDHIFVTLSSSAVCASPLTASNSIVLTVLTTETPFVTISPNPGTDVCQSTTVEYMAVSSFGGTTPAYSWVVNGVAALASPASTFSYVPNNHDTVSCLMASSYQCPAISLVSSNQVIMQVDSPLVPVVTVTAHPGTHIAPGQTVTFDANVVNGGPAPSYQWYVNGVAVGGATLPEFVYAKFNNNDSVTCQVTSSGGCSGLKGFNSVTINVNTEGVQQVVAGESDITLIPNPNKGAFTIKGTLGTGAAGNDEVSLEITNMLGQVIYNKTVTAVNGTINENIQLGNNLANGMYLLNLRSGAVTKMLHLVIAQ